MLPINRLNSVSVMRELVVMLPINRLNRIVTCVSNQVILLSLKTEINFAVNSIKFLIEEHINRRPAPRLHQPNRSPLYLIIGLSNRASITSESFCSHSLSEEPLISAF